MANAYTALSAVCQPCEASERIRALLQTAAMAGPDHLLNGDGIQLAVEAADAFGKEVAIVNSRILCTR